MTDKPIKKIKAKVIKKETVKKKISTDYIRLDSFLKLCDAVESGGFAKMVIQDGNVWVNGEICTLRGKKIHLGDKVQFNKIVYEII